jgi:hypothetical protein
MGTVVARNNIGRQVAKLFHLTNTLAGFSFSRWKVENATLVVFPIHLELLSLSLETRKNNTFNIKETKKTCKQILFILSDSG